MSSDIVVNPGTVSSNVNSQSVCHWNVNSFITDNFVKIHLLRAYLITHKVDILYLSETYLDSTYLDDDTRLNLDNYSLLRADCVFYKNHLLLTRQIGMSSLNESLVYELKVGRK